MISENIEAQTERHPPLIVSDADWLVARRELLAREKEFTRLRDDLARRRRNLPWTEVGKNYVFDGNDGEQTLADLFQGRSQLIVYHFMLAPGWEEGCRGCSFLSDHLDSANHRLPHRDVTLVAVSRAPLAEINAYKKRMNWRFDWVSSGETEFNYDFHVSFTKEEEETNRAYYNYRDGDFAMNELPGLSVFCRHDGKTFHTYSTYARGLDALIGTYQFLDLVPKGRNENPESPMDWVRRHDEY